MSFDQRGSVTTALDLLLGEVDRVVAAQKAEVNSATARDRYAQAKGAIARIERLAAFRSKIVGLRKEWRSVGARLLKGRGRRGGPKRLTRGLRTPQDAFRQPILKVLVARGGNAVMSDVLKALHAEMKSRLTPADLKRLPSSPKTVRWQNTAQWARNSLRKDGLLKPNSPRGVWEVTDKGREALGRSSR
jgi:restriction system protein